MLLITDKQDLPLACSQPVAGQHNDLFATDTVISDLSAALQQANIGLEGLFLTADAGFDGQALRLACERVGIEANLRPNPGSHPLSDKYVYFDELLYEQRVVIERTNAWLDGYKGLLVRFERKAQTGWRCIG